MHYSPFLVFRVCVLAVVLSPIVSSSAEPRGHWLQWRGPDRQGISSDTGLTKQWPEMGPKVRWRVETVGVGYSSITLKDGRIYTQGDIDGVEHIICLRESDGKRLWAVQPEPVVAALKAKIDEEMKRADKDNDGKLSEAEALARFGVDFNRYDTPLEDESDQVAAARAKRLLDELDKNKDGKLNELEMGRNFSRELVQIDKTDPEADVKGLAESRAAAFIKSLDADGDKRISKDEMRGSVLERNRGRIDRKTDSTNKGDDVLTAEEISSYLKRFEPGMDGEVTAEELKDYYLKRYPGQDGVLSALELRKALGGYRNGQGDGPRGTPTLDGDRVYAEGGNGDLTCLDGATGKTIWHVNLMSKLGGGRPGWGYSESPLIEGESVIVTPGGKGGTVVALNKMNGDIVWRSEEVTQGAHYSSPIAVDIHGQRQIVQFARSSVFGITADSGKLVWQYSKANNGTANCATPVVSGNHVFASSSYGTGGGLARIDRDGKGQTAIPVYFEKKMSNHHGGIVKVGDHMYGFGSGGLICMNFLTGKFAWTARSVGKGSLVVADGMLYLLGESHQVALAEVTPDEYRERGRFKIESQGRPSWAHPVVTGGTFYVRDQNILTAYDVKSSVASE